LLKSPTGFLLVERSDHTTENRNIKPEVVFKVQKMARYASFCLIMGPFEGELFWIFPNLVKQRNPKWLAKLKHLNDSYLRASVRTVRVVGE